ncbi:MAG: MarR family winged helix-turn-helix transcriptional regulator [Propylenella sp.]
MAARDEFAECMSCTCLALRKAARAVTQHYDRALRPAGLRATQFGLLVGLTQSGPVPMAKLADIMGLDRTSLTRNLRPLEATGWLTVAEDDEDRRVRIVAITPKGVAALRKARPAWRKAQTSAGKVLARTALPIAQ